VVGFRLTSGWLALLGCFAAVLILYGMGRRDARLSREAEQWRNVAQQAISATNAYQRQLDSLKRQEAGFGRTVTILRVRIDTLRLKAETLLVKGDTAGAVQPLLIALTGCRSVVATQDSLVGACQRRAAIAEERAVHLDSLLRVGL